MLARGKIIPGPQGWPILGCILEVDPSRLHLSFDKWAMQYGPLLSCKMATKYLVVISCPRLVKKALAENGFSDVLNDRTETSFSKYIMDNAKGVIFDLQNISNMRSCLRFVMKRSVTGAFSKCHIFICGEISTNKDVMPSDETEEHR
ncbi:hypothetical protein CHS0354_008336 [Potamilus streckersoni]|uniref:Uncharacterized protein n=1 Tax=Potamilus streckersoni TaxID=2493646 RepID=A0AAE0VSR9_9BIVA|nr:hypothetical protein CHS0354_008336 [Potamilus streckersoni]